MNKAILIGNLVRDPELRTTPSGVNVSTFSIAVTRKRPNAKGEKETDFFNVVAWRTLGDHCAKYLSKGRKVCVVGEIQNRSYEKDGIKRYITEIIASDVEFLSSSSFAATQNAQASPENANYATYGAPADPYAQQAMDMSGFEEVDDEALPF